MKREIEVPEGGFCSDDWMTCKFYLVDYDSPDWCEMYECAIEDMQKCPPCAHPEV